MLPYECDSAITQTNVLISPYREIFYVRNHLPVPDVSVNDFELEVEDEVTGKRLSLSFEDIRKYRKHSIMAAIMCGGNRRSEMHNAKAVKGLSWGNAAVGNAIWSGPRLCEILKDLGIESDDKRHVHVGVVFL